MAERRKGPEGDVNAAFSARRRIAQEILDKSIAGELTPEQAKEQSHLLRAISTPIIEEEIRTRDAANKDRN